MSKKEETLRVCPMCKGTGNMCKGTGKAMEPIGLLVYPPRYKVSNCRVCKGKGKIPKIVEEI